MQTSLHLTLLTAFMKFLRECVLWEEVKSSKKRLRRTLSQVSVSYRDHVHDITLRRSSIKKKKNH